MKGKEFGYIREQLVQGNSVAVKRKINGISYRIMFMNSDSGKGINMRWMMAIPLVSDMNSQIMFESINIESDRVTDLLEVGLKTGMALIDRTRDNPCPLVVPWVPSEVKGPYYQQLSRDCFELSSNSPNYRVDEQVLRIIDAAKGILSGMGIRVQDKIFLNGYSASGVFAQRFALIHPEVVDTACIGGASGSIPVPTGEIGYPIGVEDYSELFGKSFDMNEYLKIKFRYYVGELETVNKAIESFKEGGSLAPMHDMSYFERSVPYDVGVKQRKMFGYDMFDRAERSISILKNLGMDIRHVVIKGRAHNNIAICGVMGTNELGDRFMEDVYRESYSHIKGISR